MSSGSDEGATTLSARKLIDILRALPEGPEVSIAVNQRKATIQAGKSRFALQTLGAEEFPTVAVNESFSASFSLPQKQLKHLFQMVHFSMAQQDIRYYLNGLLLVTDHDAVRVIATVGHRLAYCHTVVEGAQLARNEVIIPRKTVLELQRLLGDTDARGQPLLLANEIAGENRNLSLEREFGKVIGRLDLLASYMTERYRRAVIGYVQGLVAAPLLVFLPVK